MLAAVAPPLLRPRRPPTPGIPCARPPHPSLSATPLRPRLASGHGAIEHSGARQRLQKRPFKLINTPINKISPRQQRRTDEPTTRKGSETHNRGVGGERSAMHAEVRLQALGLISPLLRHSSRSMHDRESTRLAIILFGKHMHDAFDKNIAQIASG